MAQNETINPFSPVDYAQHLLESSIRSPAELKQVAHMIEILKAWHANDTMLQAAYLLPLLRKDMLGKDKFFEREVTQLTALANRLIYYDGTTEMQQNPSQRAAFAEKLRRLFVYAYTDVDAVLMTVAHRIARIHQLDNLNEFEQQSWATSTLGVYVPLLEMLGLAAHRDDIGNLSLAVLDPNQYEQFANHVFVYYKRHETLFAQLKNDLHQLLENAHIHNAEVNLYEATPASLHQEMTRARRQGRPFNLDSVGSLRVDLVVKTEHECYSALGLIHNHWRPTHHKDRFHDFIASPRYNGYRALITTVLCVNGDIQQPVEFRIRTETMEDVNRYGIVQDLQSNESCKNAWWNDPVTTSIISPRDTGQLGKNEIYTFTPTGEVVYPLRRGSTAIDFAFRVHADLGIYARRFWVNGRPVPPEHPLRVRDLVELEYDLTYPSLKPEWEDSAHTSTARRNIRRALKQAQHTPHRGRQLIHDILEREMNIYEIRFPEDKIDQTLRQICVEMNCPTLDELYARVAEGVVAPDEIVATMIERELIGHITLTDSNTRPQESLRIARSWMQEKEPRKWDKSTRVMPGVGIVGRHTSKGIVVHRADSPHAPTGGDAIGLNWHGMKDLREAAEINVTAPPRSHIVGMVVNAIYNVSKTDENQALTIHRFEAEMQENRLFIDIIVDAPSLEGIRSLQEALNVIQRSGYITDFKVWSLFPGQKMLLASKHDKRQQNPYTLRQIRDRGMFFGRDEEIKRIITLINEGQTFNVIYGQKRIGKTSLLYQLAENMLPQACNVLTVPFDAHSLAPFDTIPLLSGLADAAYEKLVRHFKRQDDRRGLRLREKDLEADPFATFARWVQRVEKKMQGTRLVFIIDEFTTAEEEYGRGRLDDSFFDGMQWLAGNQQVGFLLCVHDHVFHRSSRSWGLLQRGQPIRLGSLDRASAAKLVQQPLERIYNFEPEVVDHILTLTNSHPFFIHAICQELTRQMAQATHDTVSEDDLQKAVSIVLTSGDHYFSHFNNRTDEHSWDTLKIIAYISKDDEAWVSRDEVRAAMENYGYPSEGMLVSKSIGDLFHAGILEGSNLQGQAIYRIPIGLFRIWLRQVVTHPVVSRDIRRQD